MEGFDRFGKCPICHRQFKSDECPHTYAYVVAVLAAADTPFSKDVERVRARAREKK